VIVVVPFRVSGADRRLGYLHEGLVDLLATKLTEEHGPQAADPGAVMSTWRRAGLSEQADVARDEAIAVAEELGGTRLLLGSVVGTPERMVVNATLFALPAAALRAQASAAGPADSLTRIVDQLVARLLAKEAGESERLSRQTSSSVDALRPYLEGRAAYRRGSYRLAVRLFRRAIENDTTFAIAALALANVADRIDAREDRAVGLAMAWKGRATLTERDSAYLHALAGPRYPLDSSLRERLAAWERTAAFVPERADVWHELGALLFYNGRLLGVRDWRARAAAALGRAAALDASFASPLQYAVQLTAASGDRAGVRRAAEAYQHLDSAGELSPFVRWRAAVALADSANLQLIRRQLGTLPATSLRAIALSSQDNGIGSGDAERALSALGARAVRGVERADWLLARHALALNRGDAGHALEVIAALAEDRARAPLARRTRVLDWLYGGGDSTAAADAAARLTSQTRQPGGADADADACVLGQWRAWTGDQTPTDTALLVGASTTAPSHCAALIDAIAAVRNRALDAGERVALLDSLLLSPRPDDDLATYGGLALARLYESLGKPAAALAAVRRRPYMLPWPEYLAATLRVEGRVALATGDSAAAVSAYRHYLALRPDPKGRARAQVAAVTAELSRLTSHASNPIPPR
jgi:tetratricopeptide (TPR) repeat protein